MMDGKLLRRWRELVTEEKMEGYCSTGQSPQRAVVPMEEEDLLNYPKDFFFWKTRIFRKLVIRH
jgi:hypothetical protein